MGAAGLSSLISRYRDIARPDRPDLAPSFFPSPRARAAVVAIQQVLAFFRGVLQAAVAKNLGRVSHIADPSRHVFGHRP
jgi:hypothetical protein